MRFTAHTVGIFATHFECCQQNGIIAKRVGMTTNGFFRDFFQTNAFDTRCRAEEELINKACLQADSIKNLRAAIGLVGRNAHLGHDLENALADRLDVAFDHFIFIDFRRELAAAMHVEQGVESEIWVDRFRTIACETSKVMHFAWFT